MIQTKSQNITKRQVWEAYKKVKANKGSAGVDGIDYNEPKICISLYSFIKNHRFTY